MSRMDDHPSVRAVRARTSAPEAPPSVDAEWLRDLALQAGADDAGVAMLDHPDLAGEDEYVQQAMRGARAVIGFVVRMNRENVRSEARSLANLEFHETGDEVNTTARRIVRQLEDVGIRAVNPSATFPQEMDRFPGRAWVLSLKKVAVAAGLGQIGIHRNLIHPRFGNFVLLGAVLIDVDVLAPHEPIDFNPCLECKLCVAACPVGAIAPDGGFDFQGCYTHNYREFMSGFTDFVTTVADSADAEDFRSRVSDSEAASTWQSLAFRPNYKAAYCLSVCPAGEDVLGPYLSDRRDHLDRHVRPLQDKAEPVYVLAGSYAEEHVTRRFRNKTPVQVDNGFPDGIKQGLTMMAPRQPTKASARQE